MQVFRDSGKGWLPPVSLVAFELGIFSRDIFAPVAGLFLGLGAGSNTN